jgi:hypothetical protein
MYTMQVWRIWRVLTLTALVLAALSAASASAVDTKNYPGAMCLPTYGSGGTYVNWWAAGISNDNSAHALDITCPVIKDVMAQGLSGGTVRVWDTHYTQNIECRLYSYRFETGGHVGSFTPLVSSAGSNTNQTLTVLSFGAPVPSSATNANSHYFYTCKIPPMYQGLASYVSSYSVIENGQNE